MPENPFNPGTPDAMYIHGVRGKLLYIPPGSPDGTDPIDCPVEQISCNFKVETDDITNTKSNGARVRLDGIEDATGSITFVFDSFNVPTGATNIFRPRTYVTLLVRPDGVTTYQFAALITNHQFSTGPKAGTVRVSADYESTGPITYPDDSLTEALPPLNASE